ncbi:MAG: CpsD/CapB family tyrosine-protein kinase, partial [Verrucomicrobiota bacterium]
LATEVEILESFDSARKAAEFVGPEKILAPYGGGTNLDMAARVIKAHFYSGIPRASQTISLSFSHDDPAVVQLVLSQMITNYFLKEKEIHLSPGEFDEYFNKTRDRLTGEIARLTDRQAELLNSAQIVDPATAMTHAQEEEAEIYKEVDAEQADLAEGRVVVEHLKSLLMASGKTNATAPPTNSMVQPSEETIAAYRQVSKDLKDKQEYETRLEGVYTSKNLLVQTNLAEIQEAQAKKHQMEQQFPALLAVAPTETEKSPSTAPAADPITIYNNAVNRIVRIQAKMLAQSNILEGLRVKGTNLNVMLGALQDIGRSRMADEEELQKIDRNLATSRIENVLGDPGIKVIETPTPPVPNKKQSYQVIGSIAGGGLALGLALAFLLELVLDRTFKRPQEVVGRLKLPFFLAVPYLNGHGKLRLPKFGRKVKLLSASSGSPPAEAEAKSSAPGPANNGALAPWDEKHALRPFHETLRDRLVAYFEMISLTHKPKLVAVTSCDEGAGVSTMASGLASSLSETGDGNVLLVNMNSEDGEAHHFYKGKLTVGLDDVLEKEKREGAMVQDNLYVVKETTNRDKLPIILPKRFGHLVSKMKASDYDYIIFDMPPVTQISVTPRLARFMDMVLLVIESGKTDRDVAQRAAALLTDSRANLGVVMNKTRRYVPRRLLQEL